ncbi:DUF6460 domain-containing protein [Bartonella sp. B10]
MTKRRNISNALHSFLGGTSGYVIVKLFIFSLLVGFVMNILGWTPYDIIKTIIEFFKSLWKTGSITLFVFFRMIMMGAIIVVPIFILWRIFYKK